MISLSTNDAGSNKHTFPLFLVLIVAGLAGNYFKYPIFLNIDFLFGSIFAMLTLQLLGFGRGVMAAAFIAGYTYILWNHPYAIIIMTAEVTVVGWLMLRRKLGMVLADTLYWLVIGIPLIWLFYHVVMHVPLNNTYIVMTKQTINGIVNALIGRMIYTGYVLRINSAQKTSYRELVYNLLAFFVLCPALIMLVISSRTDFIETDTHVKVTLTDASQRLDHYIETWLMNRKSAIVNLADMASSRPPQQMQPYLELAKKADINYLRVGLHDRNAVTTAYAPLIDEIGQSNIGRSFADRPFIPLLKQTLKPMLSEVSLGKIGTPKPRVLLIAPVVTRGLYDGYAVGVLNLVQIEEQLTKSLTENGTLYTLLDKNGNIIMTNRTDQKVMTTLVRGKGTYKHFEKGISQWIPALPPNTPISERWSKSYYIAEAAIGELAEWKLILEQPVAPFQKKLYTSYTGKLALLLIILLVSLALAELLSSRLVAILQESEERFRAMANSAPVLIWISGPDALGTYFNKPWLDYTGRTLEQETGNGWTEGVHPDDLDGCLDTYQSAFGKKEPFVLEARLRSADGCYNWFITSGVPRYGSKGNFLGYIGSCVDITSRKLTEKEFQQAKIAAVEANLAKSRFLSIVAHEFHTPLHLLTISTDILDQYGERLASNERLKQHRQIRNAARQMSVLINSVSTFAQHGDSAIGQFPVLLDIAQMCTIITEEVRLVWGKAHDFQISIAPDCGTTMLAKPLFRRLLENLLTNAFRFTPTGGSVTLSVCRSGNCLQIEVTDTGIGIPEKEQSKIYEAFYRGSNINMRQGLGLGLSIANDALKKLNGSMVLSSKVGGGSTFRVEIPLLDDAVAKEQLP